jgi:hypothetical protein
MKKAFLIATVLCGAAWAQSDKGAVAPVDASSHAEVDASVHASVDGVAQSTDESQPAKRPPSGSASFQMAKPVAGSPLSTKSPGSASTLSHPAAATSASAPVGSTESVAAPGDTSSKTADSKRTAAVRGKAEKPGSDSSLPPKAPKWAGSTDPAAETASSPFAHKQSERGPFDQSSNPFSGGNSSAGMISATPHARKKARRRKPQKNQSAPGLDDPVPSKSQR